MSKRHSRNQTDREGHFTASRSSSFKLGLRGTVGSPAPSWKPNLRRDGTYDSRPQRSIRETKPETFSRLDPEIGSRIFIHGLPKDVTDEDIEDLMTNTIGPVHQCYIVYQYGGVPLYKQTPSAGIVRNLEAEVADNIRKVKSIGCAMVHFQREKDAMEAWEQYHGKIFHNDNTVLRVQVVIDADETWLLPAAERAQSPIPTSSPPIQPHGAMNGRDDEMAIDAPTAPRVIQQDGHASSSNTRSPPAHSTSARQPRTAPSTSNTNRSANARTKSASSNSTQPKSLMDRLSPLPPNNLLSRIAVSLPNKPNSTNSFAIPLAPLPTDLPSLPKQPISKPANVVVQPKGRKKGPRRVAKVAARHDARLAAQPFQPMISNNRPTARDLDAEMEDYRRSGLMGLH